MKIEISHARHHLYLELPSDVALLERVVNETEAFVAPYVDEDAAYRIVLLASEAVTNAIEHGNEADPTKNVQVDLQVSDKHITLAVRDEGSGFNPSDLKNPIADDHLMDDGGRGIFLMEAMADEVHFEEEGRRIRLVFHRA